MPLTRTQLGRRLQQRREARGLSRAAVAAEVGITREYVRRLEAGLQDPTFGVLQKLARALGVKIEVLVKS